VLTPETNLVPSQTSKHALAATETNVPTVTLEVGPRTMDVLLRLAKATENLAAAIGNSQGDMDELVGEVRRISNHFDPPASEVVGTDYLAKALGCTQTWIAELVRTGEIPPSCIVPGTGNGKPWKFYRRKLDRWMRER